MDPSTIFALATAPGKSGVAVIRISGSQTAAVLYALGVSPLPSPRVATLAGLRAGDAVIDRGLVLYFPAPHSFTGEDVAELHVHGSRAVIASLLAALASLPGLRMAGPGEFTRRAFDNGKMDLTMAEGLADLIDSETEAQRRQAMRQMQGDAGRFFMGLRAGILNALALLEAYIDFPDEEIPEAALAEISESLAEISRDIARQLEGSATAERIRDGIYVAIVGAPNVGKSSLLNRLAGRDVAIVSAEAGTTRDVIEVQLDIGGYAVVLADTAGIREHAGEIEREGIRRSLERAEQADIRIVMVEAADCVASNPIFSFANNNTIILINKADIGNLQAQPPMEGVPVLPVSVKNGSGIDEFLQVLSLKVAATGPGEASFATRARHRIHLQAAKQCIEEYNKLADAGLELRCEALRRAAVEIGNITGAISVDEILGHIFSRFCIGK